MMEARNLKKVRITRERFQDWRILLFGNESWFSRYTDSLTLISGSD